MIPRTALVQLGKLIARDLADNRVPDALHAVGDALAADPRAMLALLDLVVKEAARKRPDDGLVTAYALLLGQGLEVLRYGVERAWSEAVASVAAIKTRLLSLARDGTLEPTAVQLLLRQFVTARLDLDDELQALMGELLKQAPPPSASPAGTGHPLLDMARHFDGDSFAIHGHLAERTATVPETHRAGMAAALLEAPDPALREAGLGWLLDAGAVTRRDTLGLMGRAAARGQVSGTMLRRMIAMRNWLPEAERPALDTLIKACRREGIDCAPLAAAKIVEIIASGIDGAGAQSLFALVKNGRRHAVASLLLKQGVGVREAWVSHGMTKARAEGMFDQIEFQVETFGVTIDYLRSTLGQAVSVNAQSGILPPFGLVDVLETLGLAGANPEPSPVAVPLERLVDAIPARMRGAASVKRALKASGRWPEEYGFLRSWFEDGGELDALLKGKRLSPQRCHALVLDEVLPSRRAWWSDLLCRTALMLRHAPETKADWMDFALVAREVAGDRPLAEIPVMAVIAFTTVEAWRSRSRPPR